MLQTVRKCSKDAVLDASEIPDVLYSDVIKIIDSYLMRARTSSGWNMNGDPIPFDYGDNRSDVTVRYSLYCRRNLLSNRMAAVEEVIKTDKENGIPLVKNADLALVKESGLNFNVLCNFWLAAVDVTESDFPTSGKKNQSLVPKFLSRLLGLKPDQTTPV